MYKRQRSGWTLSLLFGIASAFVAGLRTVSYTHLDVYKRQVEEESEILAPVLVLVAHVLKRVASDAVVYIAVDAETGGDEQRPEKALSLIHICPWPPWPAAA